MIVTITQQRFASPTPPPGRSSLPAGSRRPDPALAQLPVLVIEDEAMIAWMLESLLEDMGFEAITLASNTTEAVAAAEQRTPKLVISDINLGAGTEGIQAVHAICGMCNPAVVFVSAYINDNARNRISEEVANARILSKPLSGDQLSAVVRDALGLSGAN